MKLAAMILMKYCRKWHTTQHNPNP